jgi:putative ABC transport system substrate-binding protein
MSLNELRPNRYGALTGLGVSMRRREFIGLLGAALLSRGASAQQAERVRRIGVLVPFSKDDSNGQARIAAFVQELQKLGWSEGRNLQIEHRWTTGDLRKAATELAELQPDVIFATATPSVAALQEATRSVPIVFVMVADPVTAGFVASLAKPGGNITGFPNFEYGIGTKWLELLKEIAPRVTSVGVIRDPAVTSNVGQFAAIQSVAPSFGVELTPLGGRDAKEIERTITEFARGSNRGLICAAAPLTVNNRNLIISLAAQYRIPAIYPFRFFVADGGLISYGADPINFYRQAAGYVDRILKGEKPADLPVQAATKYDLVINLKTAKALGVSLPSSILSRADEIIE